MVLPPSSFLQLVVVQEVYPSLLSTFYVMLRAVLISLALFKLSFDLYLPLLRQALLVLLLTLQLRQLLSWQLQRLQLIWQLLLQLLLVISFALLPTACF